MLLENFHFHIYIVIGGVINFNNYYLSGINPGEYMAGGLSKFRSELRYFRKDQLLAVLMIIVPVTVFISYRGSKFWVQFPLFRIEAAGPGYSVIPLTQDLNFLTLGLIVWVFGAGMVLSGIILSFLEWKNIPVSFRRTAVLITVAWIFFLLSILLQNNFIVYNEEMMVFPLGIPLMIIVSWWMFKEARNQSTANQQGE